MIDYLDTHHWLRTGSDDPVVPLSMPTVARDLRSAPRTAVEGTAILVAVDEPRHRSERLRVGLRDISCFGIGLLSSKALKPGSQWQVEFLDGARRVGRHIVSVRHCEPLQSAYLAGVQFCVSRDLLQGLGADDFHPTAA